ncbi:MAG: hypothetical protein KC503_45030 [Myxococcales bacterium]|nr:hypothetical protein [Myxococcales bacterium]
MPQQLSFEAASHSHWIATLAISGAWALAFVLYRLLRWRRHGAPRPDLARVEGALHAVEHGALVVETDAGIRWRLVGGWDRQRLPTPIGSRLVAHGSEIDERSYRATDRTLQLARVRRAWPALRALELPTALVCLVHLVTAAVLLGAAVI